MIQFSCIPVDKISVNAACDEHRYIDHLSVSFIIDIKTAA